MKNYSELRAWLASLGWPEMAQVAAATGISVNTISKLRDGRTPDPRISTVEPLMNYYERRRKK